MKKLFNSYGLKIFIFFLLIICLTGIPASISLAEDNSKSADTFKLSDYEMQSVDRFIMEQMKSGKIPGISVVIVRGGDIVYKKGLGYSDMENKLPVTTGTFFELGSNSKGFTSLGIFKLQEEGKLQIDDPVTNYLPWLVMRYHGNAANITIRQLLYHTSGIPFNEIGNIPESTGDNALQEAVMNLRGKELAFAPGDRFLYSSINYDVLGLVIQTVSGKPFEKYMKDYVLTPMGMNNTYPSREGNTSQKMASGHKIFLNGIYRFIPPAYRGDGPADYFISNAEDMGKWIMMQLGAGNIPAEFRELIAASHAPDFSVEPTGESVYASGGWYVYPGKGGDIYNSGANPAFSSYIQLKPQDSLGVAVLANINSNTAATIGKGIISILQGSKPAAATDTLKRMDNLSMVVMMVAVVFVLATMGCNVLYLYQAIRRKRKFRGFSIKKIVIMLLSLVFMGGFAYCLNRLPSLLFEDISWDYVLVWAPESITLAVVSIFTAGIVFYLHLLIVLYFSKPNDKPFYTIIILSFISGLGSSFVLFTINQAAKASEPSISLFLYFVMATAFYTLGTALLRSRMITMTSYVVYAKREELINKIVNASFRKIESWDRGRLYSILNNDTNNISRIAEIIVNSIANGITLICCFGYLALLNFYGFLVSVVIILLCASLYFLVSSKARVFFEKNRSIQDTYFRFIGDLLDGYKELNLHEGKCNEFRDDMLESCKIYRDTNIISSKKFIKVYVAGESMFNLVIAAVIFIFPFVFNGIRSSTLIDYVFVFLYMGGPVRAMLGLIPDLIQMNISWNRIEEILKDIIAEKSKSVKTDVYRPEDENITIELANVRFKYSGAEGEEFAVGPVNCELNSGEIIFITGGNGSGKSTLAKLITGLYPPDEGEILVNGRITDPVSLSRNFSAVFSDYHLFKKLYGVDYRKKHSDVDKYLKHLKIDDKLEVKDGIFSTLNLSTGQKKRLALMVSYVEDRPVCLFDEWAADQDPEFRKYFYFQLLPELRERGKCVIAITHDDRYFHVADKVIKMETGKVVEQYRNPVIPPKEAIIV